MKKYNTYQIVIIFLNIILLIFGNILVLVFTSLQQDKNSNQSSNIAKLNSLIKTIQPGQSLNEARIVDISLNQQNVFNTGTIFEIKDDHFFILTTPCSFTILEKSLFEITKGTMIIFNNEPIEFKFGDDRSKFLLNEGSLVLIDSNEKNVYVYKGTVLAEDKTFYAGSILRWNVDIFKEYNLDRQNVSREVKEFQKLRLSAKQLDINIDEIFDLSPPELLEINLKDNLVTHIDNFVLKGKTESNVQGYINGEILDIRPNGAFEKSLSLKDGVNKFILVLVDKYKQTVSFEFTIFKQNEKTIYTPLLSYPVIESQ